MSAPGTQSRRCFGLWIAAWAALALLLVAPGAAYSGQATLTWDPNTEPDLAGYQIYFGQSSRSYQGPLDVGNITSYTVTGLQEGRVYFFAATAYDLSGNESSFSAEVSTTVRDTTAPVISAVAVPIRTSFGASISWTTSEGSDTQVEYGPTTAYGSSTALNASLVTAHLATLSGLAEGRLYHFRVRSRDAAGNMATSADSTFTTLDGTLPSVSITAPAAGATVAGTVTVGASATDNVGVVGVQFKLDGANLGAEDTAAPYSVSWNTTTAANGPHAVTAVARDAAGNLATSSVVAVTVAIGETTPPVVSLTSPVAGATVSGTLTVGASATDNVSVVGVQFKLDGANLGVEDTAAPYSVSWNTTTAANGPHAITAVARDAAGNSTVSPAVAVTVTNDTTAPVISAVSASNISSAGATIIWTTSEAGDSQVEYGPTTGYGSSTAVVAGLLTSHVHVLLGLAPGTLYHYRLKSRDAAGNLATSADFTFITLAALDLTTGLVGYWRLDEGSGATAADSSGYGNTGSLINNPIWTAGQVNSGVAFTQPAASISVSHAPTLNAYPLTVAVWIKTGMTTGVSGIVNKYVAGSSNGWNLLMSNGTLCAWYLRDASRYVDAGGGCPLSTSGFNDNRWHHVVFVVDGSGGRLYVDGLQKGSLAWVGAPPGAPTTTQPLGLGQYPGTAGPSFPGAIDDVRLYNRAFTTAEVSGLYSALAGGDSVPPLISAVMVSAITSTSASITWTASEPSDTQVEYGRTTAYGTGTPLSGSLVTSHSRTLSGLAPSTTYHLRARSRDAAGNLALSADLMFTTRPEAAPASSDSPPRKKRDKWADSMWKSLRDLF